MSDDDLRFGDISGGDSTGVSGGPDIINWLIQGLVALVVIYVILSVIQIMFNIPIPFI